MSTPGAEIEVPISILPEADLQHVRLLELPSELLSLLTSENPPTLYLKSQEHVGGGGGGGGAAQDANAVLCTPDKTYNIRQVSTSNSAYLTKPSEATDEGGGTTSPESTIQAIAKCDSTLELIAATKQSAVPYIRQKLPIFTSTGRYASTGTISNKAELFSHIPLSDAECSEAWSELACFESTDPPGCFIPSAEVRMQIWKTAMTAAVAEGADLTDPFIADDIPPFAMDLREDWPHELLSAIFTAASKPTPGGNLALDPDQCVRFVGRSQLEARSGDGALETASFVKVWKDLVPEAWRAKCELSVLHDCSTLQNGGTHVVFSSGGSQANTAASGSAAAADSKSTIGAKRKWHEKFRSAKRS